MSIITKGYVDGNLIITQGYGTSGALQEVLRLISKINTSASFESVISMELAMSGNIDRLLSLGSDIIMTMDASSHIDVSMSLKSLLGLEDAS